MYGTSTANRLVVPVLESTGTYYGLVTCNTLESTKYKYNKDYSSTSMSHFVPVVVLLVGTYEYCK
jgi:hypothetical protein